RGARGRPPARRPAAAGEAPAVPRPVVRRHRPLPGARHLLPVLPHLRRRRRRRPAHLLDVSVAQRRQPQPPAAPPPRGDRDLTGATPGTTPVPSAAPCRTAPGASVTSTAPFVATLLAWGEDSLRDLPWRRVRGPWAILV